MPTIIHILTIYFLIGGSNLLAQTDSIHACNDSLIKLHNQLFKTKNDEEKSKWNQLFIRTFEKALRYDKSVEFGFDSLKGIAKLISQDKRFRIINWNISKNDGTYEYYGFIQSLNLQSGRYEIFRLQDKTSEIKNPENTITTSAKWYGMLYYKIIEKKQKRKTLYTLLAWKGKDKLTSQKIIETMSLDVKGIPKFGVSTFEIEKKKVTRVIFEYAADVTMSLKYHEKPDLIIFDHLAPKESSLKGQYQFYGPDMSFDGFGYHKGAWVYIPDVDARNPADVKDKLYNKTPKNRQEKKMYTPH